MSASESSSSSSDEISSDDSSSDDDYRGDGAGAGAGAGAPVTRKRRALDAAGPEAKASTRAVPKAAPKASSSAVPKAAPKASSRAVPKAAPKRARRQTRVVSDEEARDALAKDRNRPPVAGIDWANPSEEGLLLLRQVNEKPFRVTPAERQAVAERRRNHGDVCYTTLRGIKRRLLAARALYESTVHGGVFYPFVFGASLVFVGAIIAQRAKAARAAKAKAAASAAAHRRRFEEMETPRNTIAAPLADMRIIFYLPTDFPPVGFAPRADAPDFPTAPRAAAPHDAQQGPQLAMYEPALRNDRPLPVRQSALRGADGRLHERFDGAGHVPDMDLDFHEERDATEHDAPPKILFDLVFAHTDPRGVLAARFLCKNADAAGRSNALWRARIMIDFPKTNICLKHLLRDSTVFQETMLCAYARLSRGKNAVERCSLCVALKPTHATFYINGVVDRHLRNTLFYLRCMRTIRRIIDIYAASAENAQRKTRKDYPSDLGTPARVLGIVEGASFHMTLIDFARKNGCALHIMQKRDAGNRTFTWVCSTSRPPIEVSAGSEAHWRDLPPFAKDLVTWKAP
jgi:hypothetical protein